jgi:hypothetical protein
MRLSHHLLGHHLLLASCLAPFGAACTTAEAEVAGSASNAAVSDIVSMDRNADGTFRVRCLDGATQQTYVEDRVTSDQMLRNEVCKRGGASPPGPDGLRASCIEAMSSFYSSRRNTHRDQDRMDAVQYCASGASASCPTSAKKFAERRRSSTADDDVEDAVAFCRAGGSPECLSATFTELSRRTGTTTDRDWIDSLRVCTGS